MIGRDLFIDSDLSDKAIMQAIASLFGIQPEEVLLVGDANAWPTGDFSGIRVVGERWRWSGDFPLKIELHPQADPQRMFVDAHKPGELLKRFLTLLDARGLVPDDDDDGLYGYFLIDPGHGVERVQIDGDRLERDGAIVLVRRPASVSA